MRSSGRRAPGAALRRAGALGAILSVAACATPAPPLYDWGYFPLATYQYLRGEGFDPRASIVRLEEQLQKTAAARRSPPPGLHGHLALLYSGLGDVARATDHLERERALFPESATFVDFLLRNAGGQARP